MNSRKLFALFMVFALTGSALAAQQNQYLKEDQPPTAEGVEAIQQHSVFVELVVEEKNEVNQIHKFAAVVGLVKKCVQERNVFDNAVLWFNDQFLFGDKKNNTENKTTDRFNPNQTADGDTFLPRDGDRVRWGGCFIPKGFMHAIGAEDPYGTGSVIDNIGNTKSLIDIDNTCGGCLFEYQSTFFVTDPNNHQWMVDKLVYPLSLNGNLFGENTNMDNCADDSNSSTTNFSDPRDDYPHHDRCEDNPQNDDRENHCNDGDVECNADSGEEGADEFDVMEPIFTVRIQVDPTSPYNSGFADEAEWQYDDGSGVVRQGMPYPNSPSDGNYDFCQNNLDPHPCAIEYNFMLSVDFEAFDSGLLGEDVPPGEDEVDEDGACHGAGAAQQSDDAEDGNSHPHNPNTTATSPKHCHDVVNLDLFYYDSAPHFVEANPYWDEFGAPPIPTDDCSDMLSTSANAQDAGMQESAIENRAPIVCDVTADQGFHAHDGTQTP